LNIRCKFYGKRIVSVLANRFDDELVKTFILEVSSSSSTLSLALNLIMSFELSIEQKSSFKKYIIKNNPFDFNYNWNEVKTRIFLSQLFYDTHYLKVTSWQVRVVLHEIKHLTGSNETVYCIVEIANQKFKSKEKLIDNFKFENENQIFIARVESDEYQKSFSYLISISVRSIFKYSQYSFS